MAFVTVVAVAFPLLARSVFVLGSIAVRTGVVMTVAVVAWAGIFLTIVAGARSFAAMRVVIGLGCAAAVHFFTRHRSIVVAGVILRVHRTLVACIAFRTGYRAIFWTTIGAPVSAGRNHSRSMEFSRALRGSDRGMSVVFRREEAAIAASGVLVITLHVGGF